MKRYIGTCLPHAGRYMQSRTGAVTQVSILPQSFFCYCRITFLLLPQHFFAFAASFFLFKIKKIAAPHRTRVTNSTKICRTSLVARYAAPPCVTRFAATYIASTVLTEANIYCIHLLFLHLVACQDSQLNCGEGEANHGRRDERK